MTEKRAEYSVWRGVHTVYAKRMYVFLSVAFTLCIPTFAHARPIAQVWAAFEQRCLIPFEDFQPAHVTDLPPVAGRAGAYHLPKGAMLVLGVADDTGTRSCAVEGGGLQKGYREWTAQSLQTGEYRETETPGLWMSHEWIEPRIIVEKTPGVIRVIESRIEA